MSVAKIQLVSSDLSHQETILQIVDALDHLDKVTDDVFSKIQAKIDQNASRLKNLNSRVDIADKKVKNLAEMNKKAVCMYSSAKYPEGNILQDYVSAFKDLDTTIKKSTDVKIKRPDFNLKGLDNRDINEKRRYFHLAVKKKPSASQNLEEHPDLRLPSRDTKSALSFTIFNTAENPYGKRQKDFTNPLSSQQKNRLKKNESEIDENNGVLGDAPDSFAMDAEVDGTANLFFAPALGDLPDLDLPDNLDLLNLPTDLSYMTDLGPGIAPSVQNLPDFLEDTIPEDAEALLAAPPPPPPPEAALPPPPIQPSIPELPPVPVQPPPNIPGNYSFQSFRGCYFW